jgi:hypothetical protein
MSRAEALPQLRFSLGYSYDDSAKRLNREVIKLSNDGGPLTELAFGDAIFFDIEIWNANSPGEKTSHVLIPVDGYYGLTGISSEQKGDLVDDHGTPTGEGQWDKYIRLSRELRTRAEGLGNLANIELRRFARVSYKDLLGDMHEDYFEVEVMNETRKLTIEDGRSWFKRHDDGLTNGSMLDFDNATTDKVVALVDAVAGQTIPTTQK